MYNAEHKSNQLIYGYAPNVVIVTGWTRPEYVAKKIDPSLYGAIGPLFNPGRGLAFLLRNLASNPQIQYVVALTGTERDRNAKSIVALRAFFEAGIESCTVSGQEYWRVKTTEVEGLIDKLMPYDGLQDLRDTLEYLEFTDLDQLNLALYNLPNRPSCDRPPQHYPLPEVKTATYPGHLFGHVVHGQSIGDTWLQILHRIRNLGKLRPTGYEGQWQELINLMAVVEGETLEQGLAHYLPITEADIATYIPYITEDKVVEAGGKYTYGSRLRSHFGIDQIQQIVEKLIKEVDSASCTMNLWDTEDHTRGGSPCLVNVWVRVQDTKFILSATFRSNDMFGAWPSNIAGLIGLQKLMLSELHQRGLRGLTLGPIITTSQSAHIYDDTFSYVDNLLREEWPLKETFFDPVGNFIIEVKESRIKVGQWTPDSCGRLVKTYEDVAAQRLYRKISRDNPTIKASHAMYLGMELQRAENALRGSGKYDQT